MKKASEVNDINVSMMDVEVSGFDCAAARVSIVGDVLGLGTGGLLWLTGAALELVGSGTRKLGGELWNAAEEDYEKNISTLKKREKQQIKKEINKKEEQIAVLKEGLKMI